MVIIIYIFLLFIVVSFTVSYSFDFFSILVTGKKAPFVSLSKSALKEISEKIEIKDKDVVFDLGCGDGRVLRSFYEKNPRAEFIGVDYFWTPFLLAKFLSRKKISIHFQIKKENFFRTDISRATIVFLYLFPKVLDQLLPRLEKKLPKGAIVYTVDFRFSQKKENEVIILGKSNFLGKRMYVYKF